MTFAATHYRTVFKYRRYLNIVVFVITVVIMVVATFCTVYRR